MTVLYIILGIIIGVPAYLLLNTVLVLLARPFAGMIAYLWPNAVAGSSFMNEIKGGDWSLADSVRKFAKFLGGFILLAVLILLIVGLICRLFWLVYQIFRVWFKFVKSCWNLGSKTKTKAKTKTK